MRPKISKLILKITLMDFLRISKMFLRNSNSSHILLMSVFFTLAAFIRPNGIIFVPIGLGIIFSYFIIKRYLYDNPKFLSSAKIGKLPGCRSLMVISCGAFTT